MGKPKVVVEAEKWLADLALSETYGGPAPEGDDVRRERRRMTKMIQGLIDLQIEKKPKFKAKVAPRGNFPLTGEELKERIRGVLHERGESLLNDDGVDKNVCREIATEIVDGTVPQHVKRGECFAVHIYALVRVKVCGIPASLTPEKAIEVAEAKLDFGRLFDRDTHQVPVGALMSELLWIDHVEWAEGVQGYMVDYPNDKEFKESTFFDEDGKTPVAGDPARVVIVVEGGNVRSIIKDRVQVAVAVLDHDNQKAEGKLPEAWTINEAFQKAAKVDLDPMFEKTEKEFKEAHS